MATGNMAGLVGDDADQLIGAVGDDQQTGIEEQPLTTGNEGVEALVVNYMDIYRRSIEAGAFEQWRRVGADGTFDFRVSDE